MDNVGQGSGLLCEFCSFSTFPHCAFKALLSVLAIAKLVLLEFSFDIVRLPKTEDYSWTYMDLMKFPWLDRSSLSPSS